MSSMSIEALREEIQRVQRRRSWILHLRQMGWSLAGMLALVMVFGILEMIFHFPPAFRFILFCLLWVGLGVVVWRYLRIMGQSGSHERQLAHYVEDHMPDLEQRLLTSMDSLEKHGEKPSSPFVETQWRDTLAHVEGRDIQRVTTLRPTKISLSAAALAACFFVFALWGSAPFSRATHRILWPWVMHDEDMPLPMSFIVEPGDTQIRRGGGVTVTLKLENALPEQALLYFQTDQADWERIQMRRAGAVPEYMVYLSSVTKDTTYYVDLGTDQSEQYRIQVFDLPKIEKIDVDYDYPAYTGMKNKTERDSGDIIAPTGTEVVLHVTFNRPVENGALKFDDGSTIDLDPSGNMAKGSFVVAKDGTYVIEALDDNGRKIENQGEYFVQAVPDGPPQVALTMPGRDIRVMSLEEVTIAATADDDYGLTTFTLNYSVAGGSDQEVYFLGEAKQSKEVKVDGRTVIYFEDLKVTPGDFVAYHLRAADNNGIGGPSEVISDIYFLEVVSTEEEFRRASQQGGGGGQSGQGGQSSALVENQKNIIAATWKLLNRQKRGPRNKFSEEIKVVEASQREVMQRTQMSLNRLAERFSFSDKTYDRAVTHLTEAVKHMKGAMEELASENLKKALAPEQAALQAVLKSESENRRTAIQMARNRGGAAGGGGQQREREDLRELFEMEMGRLENRYEMPDQSSGRPTGKAREDALDKLRGLAQRQERLNRAQMDLERRKNLMNEEQKRRRLEELRREQEALSRQTEAFSQRWSRQSRQNSTRSSMRSLDQSIDQMREAARSLQRQEPGTAAERGREALARLRDQAQIMKRRQMASVSDLMKALNENAGNLKEQERQILKKMENLKGEARIPQKMQDRIGDIISDKGRLQSELKDTEETLKAIGARGREKQPELARRAMKALRALNSETIGERIEESEGALREGRLGLSMEMEKGIEQSVTRLSKSLTDLDRHLPKVVDEQIQQAAESAAALRQELENLQRQTEALRSGQAGIGGSRIRELEQIREGFLRSRRYAQGLLQPWAGGERWANDARSIHRDLTRQEIEDFLNQPDLWNPLLEPVRELESALRAQVEIDRFKDKTFSDSEQEAPVGYQSLVEAYYKALSETAEERNE